MEQLPLQLDGADLWAQELDAAMLHVNKSVPESESDFAGLNSLPACTSDLLSPPVPSTPPAHQQPLLSHDLLHLHEEPSGHTDASTYNLVKGGRESAADYAGAHVPQKFFRIFESNPTCRPKMSE